MTNKAPTKNMANRLQVQALAKFFVAKNIYIHKGAVIHSYIRADNVRIIQVKMDKLVDESVWVNDEDTIHLERAVITNATIIQNIITSLQSDKSDPCSGYTTIVDAESEDQLQFKDLSVLDAFSLHLREKVVYMKTAFPTAITSGHVVCIKSEDPRVTAGQVKTIDGQVLVNRVKLKMIVG